jgi:hypothetical protein
MELKELQGRMQGDVTNFGDASYENLRRALVWNQLVPERHRAVGMDRDAEFTERSRSGSQRSVGELLQETNSTERIVGQLGKAVGNDAGTLY